MGVSVQTIVLAVGGIQGPCYNGCGSSIEIDKSENCRLVKRLVNSNQYVDVLLCCRVL